MKFRKPKLVYLPEGIGGRIPNLKSTETEYVNNSLVPTFSSSSASASSDGDDDNDDDDDDDDEWTTHIEVSEKYKEKGKEKKSISNPNDDHRGRLSAVSNDIDEAVARYEVLGKNDHRGRSVGNNGDIDDEQKKIVKQHEFWEQLEICETQSSGGRLYLTDDFVPRSEIKVDSSLSTRSDSNVRRTSPSPLLSPLTTRVVKSSFCKREDEDERDDEHDDENENENENENTLIDDMKSITVKESIETTSTAPPSRRRKRSWRVGKWKFSMEQSKKKQKPERR